MACTVAHNNIAPMEHISFPGIVRACTTTATTAVAKVATTALNAVRGAQLPTEVKNDGPVRRGQRRRAQRRLVVRAITPLEHWKEVRRA